MAGQMVLRCGKTGRLFFSEDDAKEHAEAFGGGEYANFDQVALDAKVWVCVETGRYADTEAKMNDMKRRDPDSKTWEEKDVAYLMEVQKKKEHAASRKNRFFDSVPQKMLTVLMEVKTHGKNRSAKALHFTKEKGTLEAAEAWISEHAGDADIDKIDDEFLEGLGILETADVEMVDAPTEWESGQEALCYSSEEKSWSMCTVVGADEDGGLRVLVKDAERKIEKDDLSKHLRKTEDGKVGDPNPEEVKTAVNQETLKQMMEMGFPELRSEKALYLRDNNLEHAIAWLGDHAEDLDIDFPVKPKPKVPEKPRMSKEEAEAKAAAMLKEIRRKKAEEEALSEKDKERMRVEGTKMMQEANDRLKEEERKRAFEQLRIEKEAHERDRLRLKEELRLDYINRFGKEPPPDEEYKEKGIKDKPLREQLIYWLQQLKKTYKDSNKEGLKTCLNTLKIYGTNLKENPGEPKFKTLKVDGKAFQARIAPFPEATEVLNVIGFADQGDGTLHHAKGVPDGFLIGELIKFSDLMIGQI